jgi:hypothetical protein
MVAADVLEDTWQSFLCADVSVVAVLERGRGREAVAARCGRGLAGSVDALARAPRWHLLAACRLVGDIARELKLLGRLDEARSWYERALAWDPANPYVVRGLAEVYLASGELSYAFAYRGHLAAAGYDDALCAAFDAEVVRRGVTRPLRAHSYQPDLGSLFALDEAGYARQCAVLQLDRTIGRTAALRAHSLACMMRGRVEHAYWVATLAAGRSGEGEGATIERVWSQAVRDAMHARLGPAGVAARVVRRMGTLFTPHDDDDEAAAVRLATVDELARRRDHATLAAMLHDPHPRLRRAAAGALLVAGDRRARVYVEELAVLDQIRVV